MFSIHFLLCNLTISILLGIILLLKKLLKKYITTNSRYYLWYIFVCALIIPFIPFKNIGPHQLLIKLQHFFQQDTGKIVNISTKQLDDINLSVQLGTSDFASAQDNFNLYDLDKYLFAIWIIGCLFTLVYFIYNIVKIHLIQKKAFLITSENEPELYQQYTSCHEKLKIRRHVALYASCNISSPVSYGLLYPKVIIPQDIDILLSEQDVYYIFLHELQHYKHKDAALNYISCILQIIYWFNPFIWYGFHILQKDREIACDNSVINIIGKNNCIDYGYTLIRYAEKMRHNAFLSPLSRLGGEKKIIIDRIKEIANYQKISKKHKRNSIVILVFACVLVYCISPLLTVYASRDSSYNLTSQNIDDIDLSSYFGKTSGSFVLYDMTNDRYKIYNKDLSTKRVSPDSTYKIYSGLFALEEGVINYNSSNQHWDGTNYYFDSWNKDQTLTSALRNSVNWYFQNLDTQIGDSMINTDGSRTYDMTVVMSNAIVSDDIYKAGEYILGAQNGGIKGFIHLFAPEGGTISDITTSNSMKMVLDEYEGLQLAYNLNFVVYADKPITIKYKVTTAPGVDEPLTVSKTPTLQEYR